MTVQNTVRERRTIIVCQYQQQGGRGMENTRLRKENKPKKKIGLCKLSKERWYVQLAVIISEC